MNICNNIYRYEVNPLGIEDKYVEIVRKLEDSYKLLNTAQKNVRELFKENLVRMPECKNRFGKLEFWEQVIKREKGIYHNLNKLRGENMLLRGMFWAPLSKQQVIYSELSVLSEMRNILRPVIERILKYDMIPPTNFHKCEFTFAFQQIVDTYGIPEYREVNPSLFTIISFPFLFGIMFGDVCHGLVLLSLSIYLILMHRKMTANSILGVMCPARYLLLMMGIFSVFCGFIYNEFASISLNIGDSCYKYDYSTMKDYKIVELTSDKDCIYVFGIDPIWNWCSNELNFLNSFKMKLAVIIGVSQMAIGVILKGINALERRSKTDAFCEFVPQIIFLLGLFGYMDFMIYVKWLIHWDITTEHENNEPYITPQAGAAPSIINLMTGMFLSMGSVTKNEVLFGDANGNTQQIVSLLLVGLAVISVPWMLVPKPFIKKAMFKNKYGMDPMQQMYYI